MSAGALVSQSEFARLQQVDKAHVSRLKQADRLVMVDGKVDVEASRALIAQTADLRYRQSNAQQTAPNVPPTEDSSKNVQPPQDRAEISAMSLQASRAVKENYLARMAKLEFEREIGKLVDADEVRRYAADLGASFRAALEVLPDRLAAELVPLHDIDAVRAVLVDSFEMLLQDLSEKIESGAP